MFASLTSRRVCAAWKHIEGSKAFCLCATSVQPVTARVKPHAARALSAAQQGLAGVASLSDQAFSRAFAKAERMQLQLFAAPAQSAEQAEVFRVADTASALQLVQAWLFAVLQYIAHEILLFALFVQEMSIEIAHSMKGRKEAAS